MSTNGRHTLTKILLVISTFLFFRFVIHHLLFINARTRGQWLTTVLTVELLGLGLALVVYHLRHLDVFSSTGDKVTNVFLLGSLPVLAVVVLVLTLRRPARA